MRMTVWAWVCTVHVEFHFDQSFEVGVQLSCRFKSVGVRKVLVFIIIMIIMKLYKAQVNMTKYTTYALIYELHDCSIN